MLVSVIAGCSSEEPAAPSNTIEIQPGAADQESWNTTLRFTEDGRMKVRLLTGHARKYRDRMETILDSGVYVEFYDPDGGLNATLLADSARIDDRTQDMSAYGTVHVDSRRNQTTVDTERLYYERESGTLHSDAWVRVDDEGRGRRIQGVGFKSDEALQNYTIYKPSGTFRPE
jgi:LPS export ABC transporter protein LptC